MKNEIIDVHTHCFTARKDGEAVGVVLKKLAAAGFSRFVCVGLINERFDAKVAASVMPDFVRTRGNPDFDEAADLLGLSEDLKPGVVPLADIRHLAYGVDVGVELEKRLRQGFKGIKGIFIPDENNDLGVTPIPTILGITREAYVEREREVFRFAHRHDVPLLYHMDARRYGGEMEEFLSETPGIRVVFAHLGVGRKSFARVMERYPYVMTDFASLLSNMQKDPAGYRAFFEAWEDNVCFGTDALLHSLEECLQYAEALHSLGLSETVLEKICSLNPRRFLGI